MDAEGGNRTTPGGWGGASFGTVAREADALQDGGNLQHGGSPQHRGAWAGSGAPRGDGGGASSAAEDPYEVARTIALKLLDRRDYTRGELAQRLGRRGVSEDVASAVLDRFEEVRLLDDARYAERYAVSRQQSRSLARSAVRRELLGKGVDADLVDAAVEAIDDDSERAAALALARRRARPMVGLPREVQYRRLAGALARKGYPGHVVHETVAAVVAELREQASAFDDETPGWDAPGGA